MLATWTRRRMRPPPPPPSAAAEQSSALPCSLALFVGLPSAPQKPQGYGKVAAGLSALVPTLTAGWAFWTAVAGSRLLELISSLLVIP